MLFVVVAAAAVIIIIKIVFGCCFCCSAVAGVGGVGGVGGEVFRNFQTEAKPIINSCLKIVATPQPSGRIHIYCCFLQVFFFWLMLLLLEKSIGLNCTSAGKAVRDARVYYSSSVYRRMPYAVNPFESLKRQTAMRNKTHSERVNAMLKKKQKE